MQMEILLESKYWIPVLTIMVLPTYWLMEVQLYLPNLPYPLKMSVFHGW